MARYYSPVTVDVEILAVERKRNSRNGNPTWTLHTDRGFYVTQTDASVGYDVSDGWRDVKATLYLTPTGRVWRIDRH